MSPLALHHRLMLVDLLGFGRSPKPWTRDTVDRHVSELHRVLAPRGPLTLVGHSLGTRLAVTYAARYPNQVRRLILISLPYSGDGTETFRCYDLPADVARLDKALPVLCLHGGADESAPLAGVRRFAAEHAITAVRVLAGSDHHPLLRDPTWWGEQIRAAMNHQRPVPSVQASARS